MAEIEQHYVDSFLMNLQLLTSKGVQNSAKL